MVDLVPIETGDMETCPTQMAVKLKEIIPLIEKALEQRDGNNPYAVYSFDTVKELLGSDASNEHGFVACINRLLSERLKDQTDLVAHAHIGNIMFNRSKGVKMVVR